MCLVINGKTPIVTDNILRNHTFNAYGATGNVTGELVYANYGVCVGVVSDLVGCGGVYF